MTTAITVTASAMPGNTDGHHWPVMMFWKPMAIMLPHSGVGATTPAPTKLSPAVSSTDQPILTDSWLRTGAMELGMIWRMMIARSDVPAT